MEGQKSWCSPGCISDLEYRLYWYTLYLSLTTGGKIQQMGTRSCPRNSVWRNRVSGHIDSESLLLTFICCYILTYLNALKHTSAIPSLSIGMDTGFQKADKTLINTWEHCNKYMQRCQTEWDKYTVHTLVTTTVHHALLVSYPLLEYKCIFNVKMLNKRQHSRHHSITPCKTHYWSPVMSRNAQPKQHNGVFITNSVTHNHPSSSIFIVESPLSGSLASPSLQLTRTRLWMKNFNLWSNQICTH